MLPPSFKSKGKQMAGLWKSSLNPSTGLRIEFTDPNLKKMIKVDEVRINFTNCTEIGMNVQIKAYLTSLNRNHIIEFPAAFCAVIQWRGNVQFVLNLI